MVRGPRGAFTGRGGALHGPCLTQALDPGGRCTGSAESCALGARALWRARGERGAACACMHSRPVAGMCLGSARPRPINPALPSGPTNSELMYMCVRPRAHLCPTTSRCRSIGSMLLGNGSSAHAAHQHSNYHKQGSMGSMAGQYGSSMDSLLKVRGAPVLIAVANPLALSSQTHWRWHGGKI